MLFRPKGLLGNQELSLSLLRESFKNLQARWRRKKKDGITSAAE
jgi:hypothetical protein